MSISMKGEKRRAAGFLARNSLLRNTLPISPLNPKTWRDFLPNPNDSKRPGGGGYHSTSWLVTPE